MAEIRTQNDYQELLDELWTRVLAEPVLAAEQLDARRDFPQQPGDVHGEARFREWFLLERPAVALGAPPALAWAPQEIVPQTAWSGLLEALFGVYRVVADGCDADDDGALVQELWTGRRFQLDGTLPGLEEDELIVGRTAPAGEHDATLLPGTRILSVPGMIEALRADLAEARLQQPRARLGQLDTERMFASATPLARADEDAAGESLSAEESTARLHEALDALLIDQPGWDADRAFALLGEGGQEELLDRLAFDSRTDLEEARRLLVAYRHALTPPMSGTEGADLPQSSVGGDLDHEAVAAALEAFDDANADAELNTRFAKLEQALGLESGVSKEAEPLVDAAPAGESDFGPQALPGMSFWIATYAWEMEQLGTPAGADELRGLAFFADFLNDSREGELDAQDVAAADVCAYLLAAPNPEDLERRLRDTARFLAWLRDEQQAALEHCLAGLATDGHLVELVRAAVYANAILRAAEVTADGQAIVCDVDPLQVESEEGPAPVDGFPEDADLGPRTGDRLLGHWQGGRFQVAAWLPATLLGDRS